MFGFIFLLQPDGLLSVGVKVSSGQQGEYPRTLGEQLTLTMRSIVNNPNKNLRGVIDAVDYNESRGGEREISDTVLRGIIETFFKISFRT